MESPLQLKPGTDIPLIITFSFLVMKWCGLYDAAWYVPYLPLLVVPAWDYFKRCVNIIIAMLSV